MVGRSLAVALLTGLALGCGGGGGHATTSGGSATGGGSSTGGTTGGGYSKYDTLTGTFTATGVNATFSGAMEGAYSSSSTSQATGWDLLGGFDDPNDESPAVTVSAPAGDKGTVTFAFKQSGPPAAATYACGGPSQLSIAFSPDGTVANSFTGQSCTVTLDAPTLVASDPSGLGYYFAHGSVTATMAPSGLAPAGTGPGTLSATW